MKKILLSAAFIAASFTSIAQVGINTTTPHASAALEVESTTKGFLPPRMTQLQIVSISAPAEGLTVYCLNCTTKGLYVNNGSEFINISNGISIANILSSTGKVWMGKNLGATQMATSSTDADSYGDLYQWGRAADGHQIRTSPTTTTTVTAATVVVVEDMNKFIIAGATTDYNWTNFADEDLLWQGSTNNPCPNGFRVPTEAEFEAERVAFPSNNSAGAFTALKLPDAGYRNYSNGTLNYVGTGGIYWSSTVSGTGARFLSFGSSNAYMDTSNRASGLSVRCIKE